MTTNLVLFTNVSHVFALIYYRPETLWGQDFTCTFYLLLLVLRNQSVLSFRKYSRITG